MAKVFVIMGEAYCTGVGQESWVVVATLDEKKANELLAKFQAVLAMGDANTMRTVLAEADPASVYVDLVDLSYELVETNLV